MSKRAATTGAYQQDLRWKAALFTYRRSSGLQRRARVRVQAERATVLARMREIDEVQMWLAEERRELLARAEELHEALYPRRLHYQPRRPPVSDDPPVPPTVERPRQLEGAELRYVLRSLLRTHGRLTLRELHRLLHLKGYEIAHQHSVKALADAARYEVLRGRLVRVARGVYSAVQGAVSRSQAPLPDPVTWVDPWAWATTEHVACRSCVEVTAQGEKSPTNDASWASSGGEPS